MKFSLLTEGFLWVDDLTTPNRKDLSQFIIRVHRRLCVSDFEWDTLMGNSNIHGCINVLWRLITFFRGDSFSCTLQVTINWVGASGSGCVSYTINLKTCRDFFPPSFLYVLIVEFLLRFYKSWNVRAIKAPYTVNNIVNNILRNWIAAKRLTIIL